MSRLTKGRARLRKFHGRLRRRGASPFRKIPRRNRRRPLGPSGSAASFLSCPGRGLSSPALEASKIFVGRIFDYRWSERKQLFEDFTEARQRIVQLDVTGSVLLRKPVDLFCGRLPGSVKRVRARPSGEGAKSRTGDSRRSRPNFASCMSSTIEESGGPPAWASVEQRKPG